MGRQINADAKVKCEICGEKRLVNIFFCMQEGWPKCCKQTMALITESDALLVVRLASQRISKVAPITGFMNWPLFFGRGLDIPRRNVKG